MGKSGDALRAAKRQQSTYTFTRQQLAEHDQHVRDEFRHRVEADVAEKMEAKFQPIFEEKKKELEQAILDEWDERKRLFASEVPENNFFEFLSCSLAVSVRVLIEKFKWKPVPEDGRFDRRLKIAKFSDCVKAEMDMIAGDEMMDIRRYSDEVYKLYGIKFATEEEEES